MRGSSGGSGGTERPSRVGSWGNRDGGSVGVGSGVLRPISGLYMYETATITTSS